MPAGMGGASRFALAVNLCIGVSETCPDFPSTEDRVTVKLGLRPQYASKILIT